MYRRIRCPACGREAQQDDFNKSVYCKHCEFIRITDLDKNTVFEGKMGSREHVAFSMNLQRAAEAAERRIDSAQLELSGLILRRAREDFKFRRGK